MVAGGSESVCTLTNPSTTFAKLYLRPVWGKSVRPIVPDLVMARQQALKAFDEWQKTFSRNSEKRLESGGLGRLQGGRPWGAEAAKLKKKEKPLWGKCWCGEYLLSKAEGSVLGNRWAKF